MSEIEHAKMLVRLANADLKALSVMLDANTFEESVFGFHAQQAVEKSLKAWIEYLGGEYPLRHDIRELLRQLQKLGVVVDSYKELIDLNIYAVTQ